MSKLNIDYKRIGSQIRNARKGVNMTQATMAEKINLSVNHISHIECGASPLSLPALLSICEVLNCTADRLLYDNLPQTSQTYRNADIKKCFEDADQYETAVMLAVANSAKQSMRDKL
jgi:transcriptional regulator with XRE-family HTH domain